MSVKKPPELFSNKAECMGCGACSQLCPTKAIRMEDDEEGFPYPRIDEDKCVCCRKCLNVCPLKQVKVSHVAVHDM